MGCLGSASDRAFVGGGGKTTLGLQVLHEGVGAGCKALFTTTTRILVPHIPQQVDLIIETSNLEEAVDSIARAFIKGFRRIALISSREMSAHGQRAVGIPPSWIDALCPKVADLCVVEADGSRMLPFKAPKIPREPVLPDAIAAVVAVVGVDALGVPLDEDHVCRADIVSELTQTEIGKPITSAAIGKVLGNGDLWCQGLHGVPFHVVINKVGIQYFAVEPGVQESFFLIQKDKTFFVYIYIYILFMCIAFLPFNMVELRTCEIGWSCLQVDSASQLKPAQEILAVVSSGSKVASIAVMGQSSDTRKIWDYWKGALLLVCHELSHTVTVTLCKQLSCHKDA